MANTKSTNKRKNQNNSTVKVGGSKASNKKRFKLLILALGVFLTLGVLTHRIVTGNWIGADAATVLNYNPYYSRCNPEIRNTRSLKEGDKDSTDLESGTCVKAMQRALNACCGQGLLEDGIFGPKTKQAVLNLQAFTKDTGPSGILDKELWGTLDYFHYLAVKNSGQTWKTPETVWAEAVAARNSTPTPTPTPTPTSPTPTNPTVTYNAANCTTNPELNLGDKSNCVAKMQKRLNDIFGSGISVDGIYGTQTQSAVRNFAGSYTKCIASPVLDGTKWLVSYWLVNTTNCLGVAQSPNGTPTPTGGDDNTDEAPNIPPPPTQKPLTECVRYTDTSSGGIVLRASPSDTYRASDQRNGCYQISNNLMVACFTGYKLYLTTDGKSSYCAVVPYTSISNPPADYPEGYRVWAMPKYTEKTRCGFTTTNVVGIYVLNNTEYKGYPSNYSWGCHKGTSGANFGDPMTELVKCFGTRTPHKRTQYINGRAVSDYKCITL